MAKQQVNWVIVSIIAVLVVGGLMVSGIIPMNLGGSNDQIVDPVTGAVCDSQTTPDLLLRAYDRENVGSAIAETGVYRLVGTKTWTTFTSGTEITGLEVGKEYEFLMGVTTADAEQIDNAYGKTFKYTVPCKEDTTIEEEMANDELEGSLTATFYNKDDNAGAQTFLAGETHSVELRFKAGVDEVYGNPYLSGNPNVLCLDLNTTTFDKPEAVSIKGGADLKSAGTPQRHSAVAGKVAYCYEAPVIGDKEVTIEIEMKADDSTAPAVDDTAYLYAGGYYIDAKTGNVASGVEDEEGTAVGTSDPDAVTIDVTA
jgi:hypothetical protein